VVTGFIEEGRVLGRLPSVEQLPLSYITEKMIFITIEPKMPTQSMKKTSSPDLVLTKLIKIFTNQIVEHPQIL